jgi:hypothetical protein
VEGVASGIDEIGRAIQFVRRLQNIAAVPLRRGAQSRRLLSRALDHPLADIHPHDFGRAVIPQGEGVPAAGALQVDRAPAPGAEVFQIGEL